MTRLAKPEKKAGKGNERREIYAKGRTMAIGFRSNEFVGYQRVTAGFAHRMRHRCHANRPLCIAAFQGAGAPAPSTVTRSLSEVTE